MEVLDLSPVEVLIQQEVSKAIAQTLLQVSATLERPFLVGQPIPVLDKTLGNEAIVASDGWEWLQGHKFAGTIGKPGSPATLADDRLKLLYLKQGKIEAQWDALETAKLPDLRGRSLIAAGQGEGLSDRQLWEEGGEESHAPTEAETFSHDHGGANHGHAINIHMTSNLHGISAGNVPNMVLGDNMGPSNRGAYPSGNIITPQGGNQPFNVMQPYFAMPVLIFLGVLAI